MIIAENPHETPLPRGDPGAELLETLTLGGAGVRVALRCAHIYMFILYETRTSKAAPTGRRKIEKRNERKDI